MYIVNTNSNLLGKTPFTANKNINTVDAFNAALNNFIKNITATYPDITAEYGIDDDTEPNMVLESFLEYMLENSKSIPLLDKACKTMNDFTGVHTIDMDDMAGVLGFDDDETSKVISIDDKFACMYNVSSVGDDALCLVASIVYFDEDMNLCIYVPTCGNARIPGTNYTLGNASQFDTDVEKLFDKLIQKHSQYVQSKLPNYNTYGNEDTEYNVKSYLAYEAEFGTTVKDNENWIDESLIGWECDIVPNEELITKDIASNVKLA